MSETPRTISSDTDEVEIEPEPVKRTPKKALKVKTPPAPLSVKKRALEAAAAEMDTPRSKKARVHKRNNLLWKHFQTTNDPAVVICIANPSCRARIRRPGGSTSGMRSPFEAKHPAIFTEFLRETKEALKEKVCRPRFYKCLRCLNEYLTSFLFAYFDII